MPRPVRAAAAAAGVAVAAVVLAAWLAPETRRRPPRPAPASMAASSSTPTPTIARGGEWASPVTSALLVAAVVRLAEPAFGPDGALYHAEARPAEEGRTVIVRDGVDVTPAFKQGEGVKNLNARTRVHEYGGGAFAALPHPSSPASTLLVFSNFEDQRLWAQTVGPDGAASAPAPLTRAPTVPAGLRYADVVADPPPGATARRRAYCVLESHEEAGAKEPWNAVGAVDLESGAVVRLTGGAASAVPASDFVAFPTPSPDGSMLAWIAWDHPNMPWDATTLLVSSVAPDGSLSSPLPVAGGADVSVQAPLWLPDGGLAFVSDEGSGWWNVWRTAPGFDVAAAVEAAAAGGGAPPPAPVPHVNLAPAPAEYGGPVWVHGLRPLARLPDGRLLVRKADPSSPAVEAGTLDPSVEGGALSPLHFPFAGASRFAVGVDAASGATRLATVATRPDAPSVLVTATLEADGGVKEGGWRVVARAHELAVDRAYLPAPRVITFPTDPVPGEAASPPVAHGIYYPPTSPTHALPAGAAPPVLVKIHGGPTAAAGSGALSMGTVYWTSRGFAVMDVNYRGSTSYGRAYRNALRGNWGVADVADVAAAVKHLAAAGLADPARAVIDGGSAGGFTTLAALAFQPDVFAAGTSLYGVADCSLLAADTHKFESRYLDSLIGPYPAAKATYDARSPINAVDRINAGLLLLQGDEDRIVPPNQATLIHDKLKARGVPTALIMYEGEQHGFRKAANIRSAYDSELWFYGKVLGFEPQGIEAGVRLPDGIANLVSVSVE